MSTATMPAAAQTFQVRPPAGRRNWWRLVVGAMVVVASAVGFAAYGTVAADTAGVLVVARPVQMGQPLTAADVTTVQVRLSAGVRAVPAKDAELVLGRAAAVPLSQGMVLAPEHVGPASVPAGGQVVMAVAVPLPPAGLVPGAPVRVLVTPGGPGSGEPGEEQSGVSTSALATVVEVGAADGTGARVVSLLLPADDGERVAVAAVAGQVSLVVEAVG